MKTSSLRDQRASHYAYVRDYAPELRAWRTLGRTRALVATYFAGLATAIASWVMMLLSIIGVGTYLGVYVGALLVSMVAFTVLRCTIDGKDMAPPDELDDYEQEIMASWHDRSHCIFETVLLVGGFVFILASTFFHDYFHPAVLGVSAGLYMLFTYLAVGTLPAVGFAATFNNNPHDQPEELF